MKRARGSRPSASSSSSPTGPGPATRSSCSTARVVLSRPRTPLADSTWRLAGLPTPQEHAARVLTNLDVPGAAIVRLETVVENTEQELALDFAWARAQGLRRVLPVTSPYHTRRVRVLWNARYERALPALVYPTSWEPRAMVALAAGHRARRP